MTVPSLPESPEGEPVKARECQFSDATHLEHTPFSERAPACWACFNGFLDQLSETEIRMETAIDLLREHQDPPIEGFTSALREWKRSGAAWAAEVCDREYARRNALTEQTARFLASLASPVAPPVSREAQ